MILLKNNRSSQSNAKKLRRSLDNNKKSNSKIRLSIFKSCDSVKFFHPLKQKKIKLHRLRFISNEYYNPEFMDKVKTGTVSLVINIPPSEYVIRPQNTNIDRYSWSTETDIVEWLRSIGVQVKKISSQKYMLKDRICLINNVLVFANKKRIETGLEPFYLDEYTEF